MCEWVELFGIRVTPTDWMGVGEMFIIHPDDLKKIQLTKIPHVTVAHAKSFLIREIAPPGDEER